MNSISTNPHHESNDTMKIKTTHVGSLPRPEEMNIKNLKKIPITQDDLRTYLQQILEKQISLGVTYINNGELPRADYINATVNRIAGFNDISCSWISMLWALFTNDRFTYTLFLS